MKPRDLLIALVMIIPFAGFILYTGPVREAVGSSLTLCGTVLIPSVLPCMVMTNLLLESGIIQILGKPFEKIIRQLFHLPGVCAPVLMIGLTAGYPVGARGAILLYKKDLITRYECERLLAFCNNSGPSFIFGTLGLTVFASSKIGVLLFIAHLTASLTVGQLFRFYRKENISGKTVKIQYSPITLSAKSLADSISAAADSIIHMTAYVTFFSATVSVFRESGLLMRMSSMLSRISGRSVGGVETLLIGMMELTGGVFKMVPQAGKMMTSVTMASFLLGWAGLSIHFQVLSFLGESRISVWPYFMGKMLHGVLSAVYTRLLAYLVAVDASVSWPQNIPPSVGGFRLFCLSLLSGAAVYLFFGLYTALRQKRF